MQVRISSSVILNETIESPKTVNGQAFGQSLAAYGQNVLIGEPWTGTGSAYFFNSGSNSQVNRPPSITASQIFTVTENSAPGTVVGTVSAQDADAGQSLSYLIIGGNTNVAFEINSTTGQIKVKSKSALDYETKPSLSLTVRVTDSGNPALSTDGVVTVNLTDVPDTRKRIESLFSTGVSSVNSAGAVSFTTPGLTDPHFTLVGSPAGVVLGEVKVALTDRYPFTTNEWGNDPLSQYISPFADGRNAPVGDYVYQTQFDATGFDPSTIELKFDSYAFDNSLTEFRVNGGPLQTSLSVPVTVGFVNGINTIQFVVYNAPGRNSNPTGFRVAMQASGVVIPSTAAMASPIASPVMTDIWILSNPIDVKRIFSL